MMIFWASAERFVISFVFTSSRKGIMRACFLGQNICGLGFGVATLRTPPLVTDQPAPESPAESAPEALTASTIDQHVSLPALPSFSATQAVANSPRPMA
jgi:hypothetical protein